jgi:hypothetical protein
MDEKVSRSPLTKKFPETLVMPISETLPNACNVVDIIAKIPADFCNFTPPIFAITPPSSSDFCKFAAALPNRECPNTTTRLASTSGSVSK